MPLRFFLSKERCCLQIGVPMIIASIAGNYLGSNLSLKSGDKIIRPLITVSILTLFVSLGVQYAGDIFS